MSTPEMKPNKGSSKETKKSWNEKALFKKKKKKKFTLDEGLFFDMLIVYIIPKLFRL